MIHMIVDHRYRKERLDRLLRKTAEFTLEHQKQDRKVDLSLVITGDAKLKKLNAQFRGKELATDVLSFPSGEDNASRHSNYLGDVVISLPRARAQAKARGHSLPEELQLLTVHGILHLLGYDHATLKGRVRMWSVQGKILHKVNPSISNQLIEQL